MSFKDDMVTDLDVFFNSGEFAEAATYTPSGGEATDVTVILTEEDPSLMTDPMSPGDSLVVLAQVSEIESPGRGDIFTINGEDWYFAELLQGGSTEGIWHIRVSRSERPYHR